MKAYDRWNKSAFLAGASLALVTLSLFACGSGNDEDDISGFTPSEDSANGGASSASGRALSSSTVTLSAQKITSPNAVDLDAGITYTGAEAIAQAKDKVDLIYGYDKEEGVYYLATPKGTSVLPEYAEAANASYTGAVYDFASFTVAPELVKSSSQIELDARDKADYVELLSNGYVIVTSDLYDASTGKGLYLVRVPVLTNGYGSKATLTVWSVAP